MARSLLGLALLALALTASHVALSRAEEAAYDISEDPDFQAAVRAINASSFHGLVTSHDLVLVTFFSGTRDASTQHMTVVSQAADALGNEAEGEGEDIVVATVDVDEEGNKGLLNVYDIKDTPHSIIIKAKKWESPSVYSGPWDSTGLVTVLKRLAGPAVKELSSEEDKVERLLLNEGFLVVAYVEDTSSAEFKAFTAVAESLRHEFVFRYTSNTSALSLHGDVSAPASLPAVRLVTSFDRSILDSTDFEAGALTFFIWANSLPPVIELGPSHADYFISTRAHQDTSTSKAYLFVNYGNGESPAYRFPYLEYAQSKPAGIAFFIGNTEDNVGTIQKFGLSPFSAPMIVFADKDGSLSYRTSIKPEEVKLFLDNVLAGKEPKAVDAAAVNATRVESQREPEEVAEKAEAAAADIDLSVSAPVKDEL